MAVQKKPLKIPSVLICLGRAVEVKGDSVHYYWTIKDSVELYTDHKGESLYCIKTKKKKTAKDEFIKLVEARKETTDKAQRLYERWHDFEPLTGSVMTAPRGFLFNVGRCRAIVYESDKWTGKKAKYIHEFSKPPILWVNNKTKPTAATLTGGKIRVRKAGITG